MKKEEFIEKARNIHGDKYIYDSLPNEFYMRGEKIKITCPIHGDFLQEPRHHINGSCCPMCSHKSTKYTNDEFLEIANKVHGGKYTYIDEYKGRNKKIRIICPIHGEFIQVPYSHLNGAGCTKCADELRKEKRKLGWKTFVELSKKKHNDEYEYYENFEYINNIHKVPIICKKHGVFWQTPNKHLAGCGCPICSNSKLEKDVSKILNEKNIKYISQYNLPYNKRCRFDFYLPDYNTVIECQGKQHFEKVEYFEGEKGFKRRNELDKLKYDFCKENNIKILYYSNLNFDNFLGENIIHDSSEIISIIKG